MMNVWGHSPSSTLSVTFKATLSREKLSRPRLRKKKHFTVNTFTVKRVYDQSLDKKCAHSPLNFSHVIISRTLL